MVANHAGDPFVRRLGRGSRGHNARLESVEREDVVEDMNVCALCASLKSPYNSTWRQLLPLTGFPFEGLLEV